MESKKKLYRPIDYATYKGITPSAVTRQMKVGTVKVVIKGGRRFIEE